ncbi:hypothetical protein OE88DRAFT_1667548 [Heliocybe sulcata]|uniref:Fungal-type protein kinase domain-containing protein n=1 Tax=Heliocybe sulcata TaxID=5364 RepID=A0A5C3MNQ3_9AGAM|nr:hypothetical protein OE88DRAFT_1667548 [Heliocybe sulcata]
MEPPTTPPGSAASLNPTQSTPPGKRNTRTFTTGQVKQIRPYYEEQMKKHVEDVSVRTFLLFLLSLFTETKEKDKVELEFILDELLLDAVIMCNAHKTLPIANQAKSASPEDSIGGKIHGLLELLAEFRQTKTEQQEYAPFCKLANTILAIKKTRPDPTSVGCLPPASGQENQLVFQCNDPTEILSEHVGADGCLLAETTKRKPDVVGLMLRDALLTVKEAAELQLTPGENWDDLWEKHRIGPALKKSEKAPAFDKTLVSLEFKRTDTPMEQIPLEFKMAEGAVDVPWTATMSEVSNNDVPGKKRKSGSGADVPSKKSKSREGTETKSKSKSKSKSELRAAQYEIGVHERDPDQQPTKVPPDVQVAIYASERLSSSVAINHSFQFIINNSVISLWWFDRCSAIRSGGFDFITNLPYLVVVLDILRRFDEHAWGSNRVFRKTPDGELKIELATPDAHSITVTLKEAKYARALHLFGRATDVIDVENSDVHPTLPNSSSKFVAKIYHPDERRESEVRVLARAYGVACSGDKDAKHVRGHLPMLCASADFDDEYAERMTKILGISRDGKRRCFRRLRVLLFEHLEHIYKLSGPEFMSAFYDCFRCHGVLWQNDIHHRDISEDNLMFTRRGGHVVGVLNDFDLSVIHAEGRSLANERTGTIPFMASALLWAFGTGDSVAHLYEHDVESFAYVGLWICARYKEGKVTVHRAYREWTDTIGPDLIAGKKRVHLTHPEPATESHTGHFATIMALTLETSRCISRADERGVAQSIFKDMHPGVPAPPETPKAYFERLCELFDTKIKSMDPEYDECSQAVARFMEGYQVPHLLHLWHSCHGDGHVN